MNPNFKHIIMSTVHIIDHPMIQHKLSIMRDKNTGSKDFRQLLTEISLFMGYEVTLIPVAKVGHIGLYRNEETHEPVEYFCKLPEDIQQRLVIVTDPMLATGGSSIDALTLLKKHGCTNIRLMCLVAAPEGLAKVQEAHPDVDIYVAAVDDHLNENAYIVPGLGDAGDRIFGTK